MHPRLKMMRSPLHVTPIPDGTFNSRTATGRFNHPKLPSDGHVHCSCSNVPKSRASQLATVDEPRREIAEGSEGSKKRGTTPNDMGHVDERLERLASMEFGAL